MCFCVFFTYYCKTRIAINFENFTRRTKSQTFVVPNHQLSRLTPVYCDRYHTRYVYRMYNALVGTLSAVEYKLGPTLDTVCFLVDNLPNLNLPP